LRIIQGQKSFYSALSSKGKREILDHRIRPLGMALAAVLLLAVTAQADVAIKGMKTYDCNYIISNIGNYPNYVFLTTSAIWDWTHATVVDKKTGSFGGGYKLDDFVLHAVKTSDLRGLKLNSSGDLSPSQAERLKRNNKVLTANMSLRKASNFRDTIPPLEKVFIILKIDYLDDATFNISRVKAVFDYTGGKRKEESFPLKSDGDVLTLPL